MSSVKNLFANCLVQISCPRRDFFFFYYKFSLVIYTILENVNYHVNIKSYLTDVICYCLSFYFSFWPLTIAGDHFTSAVGGLSSTLWPSQPGSAL